MKSWLETGRTMTQPKMAAANLKLCPLCDSLNARDNATCFVCDWHGEFIDDPHRIHLSLVLLVEQCPELASEIALEPKPKTTWQRIWALLTFRPRRRQLDLWA
jgi:hypothetical protein